MEIGKKIGRYEIIELLGQGGMGDVFLARDATLDRMLAIKVLNEDLRRDPASLRRFEKEARAASKLNHPNIMMIYEVGEEDGVHYIASELIEGKTLRRVIQTSSPSVIKILDISAQIASGLAAAHGSHIIHRDIKPENVIVRPDGFAKILDFGLAKLQRHDLTADSEEQTAEFTETSKGMVLGTASYMSPEQARAQAIDEGTDIFSLGVVIYEMLTGRAPFTGESISETLANLLHKDPAPLARYREDSPAELQRIVSKCLKKDRNERYQSVKEVLTDLNELKAALSGSRKISGDAEPTLRLKIADTDTHALSTAAISPRKSLNWIWAIGAAVIVAGLISAFFLAKRTSGIGSRSIRSIAVLPLENMSGDPAQEYFADGTTEALISTLSRIGSLRVISRTSIMRYKGTKMLLPDIARELDVDAVIEGSVQRSNDKVLVTAKLIDPASDAPLWANTYERQLSDILKIEGDLAQAIAGEVRISLTADERNRLGGRESVDPVAYEAYAQGRYHLRKLNDEDLRLAIEYFQKAIDTDPRYVAAYSGLADAYLERGVWGTMSFTEVEAPSRTAAEKAIDLDRNSSEGLASLATIKANYDWDWAGSEKDVLRSLEIDPNNVESRRTYGFLLMALGRHTEAVEQMAEAEKLDPLSAVVESDMGRALYRARRFAEAIPHFQKAAELDPSNNSVGGRLVDTYIEMKRYDEAMAVVSNAPENKTDARKLQIYALTGQRDIVLKAIENNKVKESEKVVIYAALGDLDKAFKVLATQVAERKTLMTFLMVEPHLEKLHTDPRWAPLMKQMKFPGY
ncbi:MAG: protein kinase [Acidobacteriota bacterium]